MMYLRKMVVTIGLCRAFGTMGFCCECSEGWNAEAAFRESALVFRGRIDESFFSRAREWYGLMRMRVSLCTFTVDELFKGDDLRSVHVYDGIGGEGAGACAYPFKGGVDYLIYAYRDADGRLWTHICTGTKPVRDAEEIANLRRWKRDASRPKTGR